MSALLYNNIARSVKPSLLIQTQEDPVRRRSHCNKLVWYPSLRLGCQTLFARGRDVARDIGGCARLCCRVGHDVLVRSRVVEMKTGLLISFGGLLQVRENQ